MNAKEKIKLPDALLDAVSGGVLFFEGKQVTGIELFTDGMTVFTSAGSETLGWGPEEQAAMDRDPMGAMDHIEDILTKLDNDSRHFEITEVFKITTV